MTASGACLDEEVVVDDGEPNDFFCLGVCLDAISCRTPDRSSELEAIFLHPQLPECELHFPWDPQIEIEIERERQRAVAGGDGRMWERC